ncbi:MAG: hypothetical protein JW982_14005 [Spirochaetes bacterium]|nr:hypothetical protein [Spirochaetota bacterium]
MRNPLKTIFVLLVLFFTAHISAKTEIVSPTLSGFADADGINGIISGFDDVIDSNIQNMANGTFFSNSTGYPVGSAIIKPFPHFFIGTSLGVGLTNMSFFDKDKSDTNKIPSGGLSGGLIFGTGIGDKMDIIGKFFYIDLLIFDPMTLPGANSFPLDLNEFSIFTVGAKVRYNQIGRKTLIPFLFNFDGLTLSVGADLMRGTISSSATYDETFNLGEIDLDGPGGNPAESVDLVITDYSLKLNWLQLGFTGTAYAYFNIIKFLNFYTGPSATIGYGFFSLESEINGNLISTSLPTVPASLITESRYSPYPFIPAYTFGLELNIPFIKITGETSVNMYNREDVTAVFGIRVQI